MTDRASRPPLFDLPFTPRGTRRSTSPGRRPSVGGPGPAAPATHPPRRAPRCGRSWRSTEPFRQPPRGGRPALSIRRRFGSFRAAAERWPGLRLPVTGLLGRDQTPSAGSSGRPGQRRRPKAAQRRWTSGRCQPRMVAGCTRSRAPADSLRPRAARIRRSATRQRGRGAVVGGRAAHGGGREGRDRDLRWGGRGG